MAQEAFRKEVDARIEEQVIRRLEALEARVEQGQMEVGALRGARVLDRLSDLEQRAGEQAASSHAVASRGPSPRPRDLPGSSQGLVTHAELDALFKQVAERFSLIESRLTDGMKVAVDLRRDYRELRRDVEHIHRDAGSTWPRTGEVSPNSQTALVGRPAPADMETAQDRPQVPRLRLPAVSSQGDMVLPEATEESVDARGVLGEAKQQINAGAMNVQRDSAFAGRQDEAIHKLQDDVALIRHQLQQQAQESAQQATGSIPVETGSQQIEDRNKTRPSYKTLKTLKSSQTRGVAFTLETVTHTLETVVKIANRYPLKESVWDASLFLCHPSINWVTNFLLFFALGLNLAMQVSLCVIVAFWLALDTYGSDDASVLALWRTTANSTKLEQMCGEDRTLSTYYFQSSRFEEALTFSSTSSILQVEIGPLLAAIVVFSWTLHVSDVLRGITDFMKAMLHSFKTKRSTQFVLGNEGNKFTLEGINLPRIWWAMTSGFVQLLIAFCLLISGSLWLVYTKSIADLMLNAVALSYIMQLDELLYNVVVPRKVKALINNMEPLEMGQSRRILVPRALPRRAIATLLFVLVFLIFILVFFIIPHAETVRDMREALCPGK